MDISFKRQDDESREPNVELLRMQLAYFERSLQFATSQKERCEELMRRKSAKKWPPKKVAKMARRLMVATKDVEQSSMAVDQLRHQLSSVSEATG